ncbi:MAG: VWA domain-containing protein [Planctomycetaceae bacterium]|jgi:hypothetical protein|nr:VWA domain-containing protein [Planctomycetaceae bacterium]
MSFDLINPAYLAIGAVGLALPVLAHLLSKKKYDVIDWGAMQFLELGRNARRKIRLEQLLLMLLRMALIALIALALARPWVSGGMFTNLVSTQSRDVVFVIDGSYSMGWEGKATTPHAAAQQWIHEFLEDLNPGDTVSLLDARDLVRPVIESPTQDFRFVREQLDALPPPSGSSNLAEATAQAVSMLSRTSNLARDVIVLTDGQARGWSPADENRWARFDDLLEQPAVRPNVFVIDVARHDSPELPNFAVGHLELSRDLTVPESPVRIKSKVMYSGGKEAVNRKVFLEVDGQRLAEKTLNIKLQPAGEASVEFEYRPKSTGSQLLSIVLGDDNLPGDNRADAALSVVPALPVLLIDGDPNPELFRSETFFAKAALSATSNDAPWVRADVQDQAEFDATTLDNYDVVVLANVSELTDAQATAVKQFVERGGGLIVSLGDKVNADSYNRLLYGDGNSLLPAQLESVESDETAEDNADGERTGTRVSPASLELPWMRSFDAESGVDFLNTRFESWWIVKPSDGRPDEDAADPPDDANVEDGADPELQAVDVSTPLVPAYLTSGAPLLVTRNYGRGAVILMTSSIDRDWGTLPTQRDFVPFLHELIFFLAAQKSSRNVEVGMPLILPVAADFSYRQHQFVGPGETEFAAEQAGDELRPLVRLSDTRLPGTYELRRKGEPAAKKENENRQESFVVNFDRGESDLAPLERGDKIVLAKAKPPEQRMSFVKTQQELKEQMFSDNSSMEFWKFLLFIFLGILVFELVMTRRLVKGGHSEIELPIEGAAGQEDTTTAQPQPVA